MSDEQRWKLEHLKPDVRVAMALEELAAQGARQEKRELESEVRAIESHELQKRAAAAQIKMVEDLSGTTKADAAASGASDARLDIAGYIGTVAAAVDDELGAMEGVSLDVRRAVHAALTSLRVDVVHGQYPRVHDKTVVTLVSTSLSVPSGGTPHDD